MFPSNISKVLSIKYILEELIVLHQHTLWFSLVHRRFGTEKCWPAWPNRPSPEPSKLPRLQGKETWDISSPRFSSSPSSSAFMAESMHAVGMYLSALHSLPPSPFLFECFFMPKSALSPSSITPEWSIKSTTEIPQIWFSCIIKMIHYTRRCN